MRPSLNTDSRRTQGQSFFFFLHQHASEDILWVPPSLKLVAGRFCYLVFPDLLRYLLFLLLLFSPYVVSNSLRPHGRQHVRLFCPSLSPGVCWDSCPLSRCCYLTISSSAVTFSFCLQSFLASGSFPMSWLFASGGQSNGASPSVLPMNIQGWFPLWLTGFISLQSKGCSRVFSRTTTWKHQFFCA